MKKHISEEIREKIVEVNDKEYKVKYLETVTSRPLQKEDFHGEKYINNDDVEVEILFVFDEFGLLIKPLNEQFKEGLESLI